MGGRGGGGGADHVGSPTYSGGTGGMLPQEIFLCVCSEINPGAGILDSYC